MQSPNESVNHTRQAYDQGRRYPAAAGQTAARDRRPGVPSAQRQTPLGVCARPLLRPPGVTKPFLWRQTPAPHLLVGNKKKPSCQEHFCRSTEGSPRNVIPHRPRLTENGIFLGLPLVRDPHTLLCEWELHMQHSLVTYPGYFPIRRLQFLLLKK